MNPISSVPGLFITLSFLMSMLTAAPVFAQVGQTQEDPLEISTFTLESAVDWALENNLEIEQLEFELIAMESGLENARSLYMPSLDLNLNSRMAGPESSIDIPIPGMEGLELEVLSSDIVNTGSLILTQPVYMFGSIALARDIARIRVEQAQLQLDRKVETIRRDVEEAYLNAALARDMVDITHRAMETSGERLRLVNVRFDVGDAARFDVLRSEVSHAISTEELLRAVTSAELAFSALARKLGLDPGAQIEITSPDLAKVEYSEPDFTLIEAWETAIANRKDYRTLALMVDLLDASADLNRDRPELILRGNYSYSDSTTGFAATQDSWSIVLNLSYNLFDGGRSESEVEQAEANRDAVNSRLGETRTLIELEVEREYREIANSIQRIEVTSATLESALEALHIAELGYAEGVITLIDYQDTDLGLHQAEILHIQAVYSYLIAESKLRAAMGE